MKIEKKKSAPWEMLSSASSLERVIVFKSHRPLICARVRGFKESCGTLEEPVKGPDWWLLKVNITTCFIVYVGGKKNMHRRKAVLEFVFSMLTDLSMSLL